MKRSCVLILILLINCAIHAQHIVSTYAGTGTAGLVNGNISTSQFNHSFGICKDKFGDFFVADYGNNCIRKITASGTVSTYAGTQNTGYKNGFGDTALFNQPSGVCVDDSGNVYVADFGNQRIRKINTSRIVSTVAGSGVAGYNDAIGVLAQFNYPRGICVDKNYNLYIGDSWNHRIRKIAANGTVTTYAGGGSTIGVQSVGAYLDAADTSARFYTPCGVALDTSGNVFVADAYTHRIRKIDTSRIVSTVIGSGPIGQGQGGYANGAALSSRLNVPTELFVDSSGNIYIGDTFNNRVRKLNKSSGTVITIGGDGTAGFANGMDTLAIFNYPRGVTAYTDGRAYVVDHNNNRIRLISPSPTGIENPYSTDLFSVYPNPAEAFLTINNSFTNEGILTIYNLSGVELLNQQLKYGTTDVDMRDLASGIYFLKLSSDKDFRIKKIIKQ